MEEMEVQFKTASGKAIPISMEALEKGKKFWKMDDSDNTSLALSQSFLAVSGQNSAASTQESLHDAITPPLFESEGMGCVSDNVKPTASIAVTRVNQDCYFLDDLNEFVSRSRLDTIQGLTETQKVSSEVTCFSGILVNTGEIVEVVMKKEHCTSGVEERKYFNLFGFEQAETLRRNGFPPVLFSTPASRVAEIKAKLADIPGRVCVKFKDLFNFQNGVIVGKVVDVVGKVVYVGPMISARGQLIKLRDTSGNNVLVKFPFGVEAEGMKESVAMGNVVGFIGLRVRHDGPNRMLFACAHTECYVDHPMPVHLASEFELHYCCELIETSDADDMESQGMALEKRAGSPEASGSSKKARRM